MPGSREGGRSLTVQMVVQNYFTEPGHFVGEFGLECSPSTTVDDIELMAQGRVAELGNEWLASKAPPHVATAIVGWSTVGFRLRNEFLFFFPWTIDILDDTGEVLFAQLISNLELRKIQAASDAGLLGVEIEPHVLAFVARLGGANGFETAGEFLQSWPQFSRTLELLAVQVAGSYLYDQIKLLLRILGQRWKGYRARNARPEDVLGQLLKHRNWPLDEFTIRFNVDEHDGRELLQLFGYHPSETEPSAYVNPDINTEAQIEAYKQHLVEGTPGSLFYNVAYPLWEHPLIQAINEMAQDLPRDDAG